jgi:hypothetical protein
MKLGHVTVVLVGKEYVFPYVEDMSVRTVCNNTLLRLEISPRGSEMVCLDFTPAQLLRIETREIKE